ncbi:VOC family protein [Robertmurraya massiliosenegalensis]|uniref:VOC family protein n=1 Tax=Robertmurraya TaxID=2837507 RepID=UPI0039A5E56D
MYKLKIDSIDHIVLTVKNLEKTLFFYKETLAMELTRYGEKGIGLKFGQQQINLHEAGTTIEPKALNPTPGSADLCLITTTPIKKVEEHLLTRGISIELGPIHRNGALGMMNSIYIRDPDENLVEIAEYFE